MLKAKDIMTRDVISVKNETPIYEAVETLVENDISGVPVVEDDMTLIGILSEKDALKLFYDKGKAENKTVYKFMTPHPIHFDEDESLLDVCDFLMKNLFRRVPITSEGKLVGVVSVKDVIKYILELRRESAGAG